MGLRLEVKMNIPNLTINIPDLDDKSLVIIAVTIIACWGSWVLKSNVAAITLIISNAFSGLFGIAVGRSLKDSLKLS